MTLDPETIAAILAVLIPMIQECLAKNRSQSEIVEALLHPTRRQRFVLLFSLQREHRLLLRTYWRSDSTDREDEIVAREIVQMAVEEAT